MSAASPESPPQTNLFGGDITPPKPSSTSDNNATNDKEQSRWFEEDDELLLSTLLVGEGNDGDCDSNKRNGDLDQRLQRMRIFLQEDLSRASTKGGASDKWWDFITETAISSGFTCAARSSPSSIVSGDEGDYNNKNNAETTTSSLPKSFNTMEGQLHLQAVVELLGISKERAVKITLATLRSFASLNPSSGSGRKNFGEGGGPGNNNDSYSGDFSSDLRSLLGTRDLFTLVLNRHRQQFLARLRIITECLRLEQAYNKSGNGDDDDDDVNDDDGSSNNYDYYEGISKTCSTLLDEFDSLLVVNGNKRGLFQHLLMLATGPSLPGLGDGRELPYSVGRLTTTGREYQRNLSATNGMGLDQESNLAIRNEAAEALLMLLYDRIDNGVQRLDLFLLMEAAKCCPMFEFGMSALDYAKKGGVIGNRRGVTASMYYFDGQQDTRVATMDKMQSRLNGIWSLLCSECMGLWRANNTNNGDWLKQHPLFAGLDDNIEGGSFSLRVKANDGLRSKTQIELEAICQELRELGNPDEDYQVGDMLYFPTPDRKGQFGGVILQLTDLAVLFDFNHPLAGQPVTFEVHLIGVL